MPHFYLFNSLQYPYWLLGCLFTAFLVYLCVQNKKNNSILFGVIALILIVLMRLPAVFFNQELNPDESQVIAHAITLKQYYVYWQSVDGATTGPLNSYFLALFGNNIDYKLAHLVALICSLLSLLLFYQSIKVFCANSIAQWVVLPPTFFLSFVQNSNYLHYSSEQLPLVLLNLALWLALTIYKKHQTKWWVYAILGFVLTMIPFAKLQASLQAFVIGIAVTVLLLQRKKYESVFTLIAGVLCFLTLLAVFLIHFNLTGDFWKFYIQGNLFYTTSGHKGNVISQFLRLLFYGEDFLIYAITIFFFLLPRFSNIKASFDLPLLVFTITWLAVGMYAVAIPGRPFLHYLNLLIYPLALFVGVLIKDIPITNLSRLGCAASLVSWVVFLIIRPDFNQPLHDFVSNFNQTPPKSKVANKILAYSNPKDRLVVWGWACQYYVETQLAQGTAESHSERAIEASPIKNWHQERFLSDITKNRPAIFIDAVVPNHFYLNSPKTQGYECFPALKDFITVNYKMVSTVDGVRIFVLKNRLGE